MQASDLLAFSIPRKVRAQSRNLIMNRFKIFILTLVLVAAIGTPGCSSQRETRTTETTTTAQPVETTHATTTTTTTTDDSGHSSLLGTTGAFVCTVVTFPFRVVGDVIGAIVSRATFYAPAS